MSFEAIETKGSDWQQRDSFYIHRNDTRGCLGVNTDGRMNILGMPDVFWKRIKPERLK